MKWILIAYIINGYGSSAFTAEFNNKSSCIEALLESNKVIYQTIGVCVEKGKE